MFENSFSQKRMKPSIKLHKSEQTLLLRKFSVLLSQWIFNDWILFYLLLVFGQLHSWLVTEVQTLRSCLSMLRSSLRVRIKCPIQMQAISNWALLTLLAKYFERQAVDRYMITFFNAKGQTMMISVRRYQTRRNLTMATQGRWSAFVKGEMWGSSTPTTSWRTSKSSLRNLTLCAETRSFLWSRKIFTSKAVTSLKKALRYINILVSFVSADINKASTLTRPNSCGRASDCVLLRNMHFGMHVMTF